MKKQLKHIFVSLKELCRELFADRNLSNNKTHIESDIIRLVHSIEKGLSIENPRMGFGVAKIEELFNLADRYIKIDKNDSECLYYVADALTSYIDFHQMNNFENEDIIKIRKKLDEFCGKLPKKENVYGGVEKLLLSDMNFNTSEIEKLFNTRHSIRDFSDTPVDDEKLRKAIRLAQRSPSACNRQGVRIYSVKGKDFVGQYGKSLDGIGGFASDVDTFLIITGKKSAYALHEKNQFIVSASMFAAYLTLTLHTYNIGACVIQRPLIPDENWHKYRKVKGIPSDEQLIMLIGIGNYKDECTVPLSKRFDIDKIYKRLD